MLSHLHIRDLAVVANLTAEFSPGMTVLTGETGAGKSVLIDALGLALGDRADKSMIRAGRPRAEISAVFDIQAGSQAQAWLQSHEFDTEEPCILRRVLIRDGASRAFVNGTPVPLRTLQELGQTLVDIHGQHAHQSLLRPDQQRLLVDEFADHPQLQREVATTYHAWQQSQSRLNDLKSGMQERRERAELLGFQIVELTALNLNPGEVEEIDREQRLLSNAGELGQRSGLVLALLTDEEESIEARLHSASRELEAMLESAPELQECLEMLDTAAIQVGEAGSTVRQFAENIEFNPERLSQVERRLGDIHDLARKYHCRPEALPERLAEMKSEAQVLGQDDSELEALEQQTAKLEQSYLERATALSRARNQGARKLGSAVSECISALGMPDGQLQIRVEQQPLAKSSPSGLDKVEFLVSTNKGHPAQPLAKIASGGELSRISLAIQVSTIRCGLIPTLIFDEVDVGIGGGIAETIGRLLRQLGGERQVLCVTHLPQVASQGLEHLLISKQAEGDSVTTRIVRLTGESRIAEVARMLGGVQITASTLAHAEEMVSLSSG